MDLKGSLVDTNLKIFPSETLLEYLKNIPSEYDIPANILKFTKKKSELNKGSSDVMKNYTIQFSNKDLQTLNSIKEIVKTVEGEKPPMESENILNTESEVENGINMKESSDNTSNDDTEEDTAEQKEGPYLVTTDIDWLFCHLQKMKANGKENIPYLHVLLEGSCIETPNNKVLKRNPDLEARCVKLRAQQEAREYRKMTKSVDNVRMRFPEDSISYQLKQVNRQLIAIAQFIISIFAGFLFGFKGVEWTIGTLDFGFRLLLGVICALVIALAEIYFLAKKLNEELSVPETTQIGGPPKFVDNEKYGNKIRNTVSKSKAHQD